MKECEQLLSQISKIIVGYLEENQDRSTKVINYLNAKDLSEKSQLELPKTKQSTHFVLDKVTEYLKYAVRTSHPLFNNQLNGGFNSIAMIADLVTHLTNTSMATYEIAPLATLIELKLVEKLGELVGYQKTEGIMVTGGSNANMMAIHCARSHYAPETREVGNQRQFAIFVSNQAHYSFKKAVIVLGIGTDNLYLVDSDKFGKMHPSSLEEKIQQAKKDKKIPLLVASTAGTTVYGAFDPIVKIQEIAKKENLWHHVDGAWGAPCLFSENLKANLEGAALADSFTWDAHKLMGTGLITSFFLTKHLGTLTLANSGGGNKYLFHENENGEYDTGLQSLQCGRKVDSLKLWFTWQHLGDQGFKELVEVQREKALYFYNKILERPQFRIVKKPEYLNVCFQVVPKQEVDINQYNLNLRYEIIKSGKFMINFSSDEDLIFFRMVFANNQISYSDIDYMIELFEDFIN